MQPHDRKRHEGIAVKHRPSCARPDVRDEAKCPCKPTFQAAVWIARDGKRLRRNFPTLAAAKAWRVDQLAALGRNELRAPATLTFRQAADEWLTQARAGAIRNRSGDRYKPSALRGYEQAFRLRLVPALGAHKLGDVARSDLQRLVGQWQRAGLDPSTIRNTVNAVRALYRSADVLTGRDVADPTKGLRLPAVRGRRARVAAPDEAARLLAALPASERAPWALAFYAGLRLGEIQALSWEHVDLAAGVLRVRRSWDPHEGPIAPKSHAGRRDVPIIEPLRDVLIDQRARTGRSAGLVCGRDEQRPFYDRTLHNRARAAWTAANAQAAHHGAGAAPLEPIGLHEARHTFASWMIHTGVPLAIVSKLMGHASVAITSDRYGHLLPDSHAEVGAQLEAYLQRASTAARVAQLTDA